LRQHCRQFLPHALRLLHFGKIGVDKAQAFNTLVAEGAPDDYNIRAVRREQAGERATKYRSCRRSWPFFCRVEGTGQRLALPMDIAAANPFKYQRISFYRPCTNLAAAAPRSLQTRCAWSAIRTLSRGRLSRFRATCFVSVRSA
jgi:hypothetical protein